MLSFSYFIGGSSGRGCRAHESSCAARLRNCNQLHSLRVSCGLCSPGRYRFYSCRWPGSMIGFCSGVLIELSPISIGTSQRKNQEKRSYCDEDSCDFWRFEADHGSAVAAHQSRRFKESHPLSSGRFPFLANDEVVPATAGETSHDAVIVVMLKVVVWLAAHTGSGSCEELIISTI
jgi:hypothetical protein